MRMALRSGRIIDLLKLTPEDIDIGDIAHGLSHLCRFAGQTRVFYSVAEHSILVSKLVPLELRFMGLMHDSTEAYIGDLIRPIKQRMPDYQKIEDFVYAVIAERFGLPPEIPPEVKEADEIALAIEARDLFDQEIPWKFLVEAPREISIRTGLEPEYVKSDFLRHAREAMRAADMLAEVSE